MISILNYLSKSRLFINKMAAILNFTTVFNGAAWRNVHWWIYYSNVESVGSWLVVVDFRFICIPAFIMSSEFTIEREQWNFYLLRFLEFDVNVFKAILSIQRFFNLTEYREVSLKNHCSLCICERRQIWNTGVNLIKLLQVYSYCLRILRQ